MKLEVKGGKEKLSLLIYNYNTTTSAVIISSCHHDIQKKLLFLRNVFFVLWLNKLLFSRSYCINNFYCCQNLKLQVTEIGPDEAQSFLTSTNRIIDFHYHLFKFLQCQVQFDSII